MTSNEILDWIELTESQDFDLITKGFYLFKSYNYQMKTDLTFLEDMKATAKTQNRCEPTNIALIHHAMGT